MLDKLAGWLGITTKQLTDYATILGTLVAVLTVIIAVVKPLRRGVARFFGFLLNRTGYTRRKYKKRFLDEHGTLINIYLDRTEELNLKNTYVPLRVKSKGVTEVRPAASVLSDRESRRVIIVGGAGTGKTTLLKAFGTGILQEFRVGLGRVRLGRVRVGGLGTSAREVPLFVSLRHFTSEKFSGMSLFEYLVEHIP